MSSDIAFVLLMQICWKVLICRISTLRMVIGEKDGSLLRLGIIDGYIRHYLLKAT
jgi:hypothetical protein